MQAAVAIQPANRQSTFNGVQALRGVAAAIVVIYHALPLWRDHVATKATLPIWPNGASGVDIFFVISGFVMAVSTIGREHKTHPARAFVERRLIRIVPLYWLMTAVALIKLAALRLAPQLENTSGHVQAPLTYILASLFFIPYRNSIGIMHPLLETGWTLWFEMFFYLLFAAALACRVKVVRFVAPLLLLLAAIGMCHPDMHYAQSNWPSITFLANSLLLEFLAGLLLGYAIVRGVRLNLTWSATLGILGFFALLFFPRIGPANLRGLTWGVPAFLLVQAVVALESRFGHWWPRWTLLLGDASYSLYLSHLFVLSLVLKALLRYHVLVFGVVRSREAFITVAACLGASLLVAFPLYAFVEKPMTNFLRRRLSHKTSPARNIIPIAPRPSSPNSLAPPLPATPVGLP